MGSSKIRPCKQIKLQEGPSIRLLAAITFQLECWYTGTEIEKEKEREHGLSKNRHLVRPRIDA